MLIPLITAQCSDTSSDFPYHDREDIKKIIQEEEVSWNKGDADTYSYHFAEEGTFTNILGQYFVGHSEFLMRHQQIFSSVFKGTTMKQSIVSFKFVRENVVIAETLIYVSGFSKSNPLTGVSIDENGFLRTRLLQIFQKEKNDWKIVSYHNVDIKKGIPSSFLN
nr:SgcJ/EcaC family oxidoreductase [uncultured Chryseobacterium sp.]